MGVLVLLVGWGVLGTVSLGAAPVSAQTTDDDEETTDEPGLIERYQEARLRALVRRHLQQRGRRLPAYPIESLPTPTDSLFETEAGPGSMASDESSFPLEDVRPVRRQEKDWFRDRFADTNWAFLGETTEHTFLDTARTSDLRARLQEEFEAPTWTPADTPLKKPPVEPSQFEYWFVVNDSIPVQVMDPKGPEGRGLIVAVARSHRPQLRSLRDALLTPLRRADRAPHVDYYYNVRRERWYRTGFDGQSFFLEQIPEADVVPGQRAYLDTVRTSGSAPASDESSP
ncbi:MAG: hypothetical protein BRD51_03770 [Bacteroidetes bacterium SW_11_64_17]|nr:MAG: hypothetical protein BRD51_03770 [Bacteroidetes bacterium SW_11_64_17]